MTKPKGLISTVNGAAISTVAGSATVLENVIGMAADLAIAGRAYTTEIRLTAELETASSIRMLTKQLASMEAEA